MIRNFFIFICLFSLFGGCKKSYPDDKWPHTNGPIKRLCDGSWDLDKYEFLTSYSYQFPSFFIEPSIVFYRNGTCSGGGYRPIPNEMIYLFDFNGKWEFIENDNKIRVTYNLNPNYNKTWTIQRLDRKYMVLYCDSVKYSFKR